MLKQHEVVVKNNDNFNDINLFAIFLFSERLAPRKLLLKPYNSFVSWVKKFILILRAQSDCTSAPRRAPKSHESSHSAAIHSPAAFSPVIHELLVSRVVEKPKVRISRNCALLRSHCREGLLKVRDDPAVRSAADRKNLLIRGKSSRRRERRSLTCREIFTIRLPSLVEIVSRRRECDTTC